MATIKTILGNVELLDFEMTKKGYGQYKISFTIEFESNIHNINVDSTDSELFDFLNDLDNNSEREAYLLENQKYLIERVLENFFIKL